jgi:hypothetical protein
MVGTTRPRRILAFGSIERASKIASGHQCE